MSRSPLLPPRMNCPCCRYPTLPAGNDYEICELCNWEDDGQGDDDATEVRGGPNSHYSLAEARQNFQKYRVMYEPNRDRRITGKDSQLEYETKGLLMEAFARWQDPEETDRATWEKEIYRLEEVLQDETSRQVQDYERRNSRLD